MSEVPKRVSGERPAAQGSSAGGVGAGDVSVHKGVAKTTASTRAACPNRTPPPSIMWSPEVGS